MQESEREGGREGGVGGRREGDGGEMGRRRGGGGEGGWEEGRWGGDEEETYSHEFRMNHATICRRRVSLC